MTWSRWTFWRSHPFWRFWGGLHLKRPEEIADWQRQSQAALGVVNTHLASRRFLVADHLTTADIALYAYTHTADLSGFDLDAVPAVRAWLERVRNEPGHVPHPVRSGLAGLDVAGCALARAR